MNFEGDLPHQNAAIEAILGVFEGVRFSAANLNSEANPVPDFAALRANLAAMAARAKDKIKAPEKAIFDIDMQTGTGKTYTYTKAAFALNRAFGLAKFIIIVPSLSIKAGTLSFLGSEGARGHFRDIFGKEFRVYNLQSQSRKRQQNAPHTALSDFFRASLHELHFLVANIDMFRAEGAKNYERILFDKFDNLNDALRALNPCVIIDEPHRFHKETKSWREIWGAFEKSLIFRFGATFKENYNELYRLDPLAAFNQNLVKGVECYVEGRGKKWLTLRRIEKNEAVFAIAGESKGGESSESSEASEASEAAKTSGESKNSESGAPKTPKKPSERAFGVDERLGAWDERFCGLTIEKISRQRGVVCLSNGAEIGIGARISPESYDENLSYTMLQHAVKKHFELERQFFARQKGARIKPLSLFFIDDIESYRGGEGKIPHLRLEFEKIARAEIEANLANLANLGGENGDYRAFLEESLRDLGRIHGGYFARDNIDSDERVADEVDEILREKEKLLSLENPRRFIFSKWTLKEGWDNPNVFVICKIRTSGSEISKLQEVGRGLRLPVDERLNRVKDEAFDLHYFVDFSEDDFVGKLKSEILENSAIVENAKTLTEEKIAQICKIYGLEKAALLGSLEKNGAIDRANDYLEGGLDFVRERYPKAFNSAEILNKRVRVAGEEREKGARIRREKYRELRSLWEKVNEKVVLEYRIEREEDFEGILRDFFAQIQGKLEDEKRIIEKITLNAKTLTKDELKRETIAEIGIGNTLSANEFCVNLARALRANVWTVARVFEPQKLHAKRQCNEKNIALLRQGFNDFLLRVWFKAEENGENANIAYHEIGAATHPTKFTNEDGNPREKIENTSDLGLEFGGENAQESYLFEEVFFDSEIEKKNISEGLKGVKVFTKIPRKSIRIQIAGGGTYTPDFAYVVCKNGAGENGEKFLLVESKGKRSEGDVSEIEEKKMAHARVFFKNNERGVSFSTQFEGEEMEKIIEKMEREG